MRKTLIFVTAIVLAGCAAGGGGDGRLEVIGKEEFRYTERSSVIRPLYSEQAEHGRLMRLDHRIKEANLCPAGYRIVEHTPPMAYGRFNKRVYDRVVTEVTYTGRCA
jgi:hypothetical protein